mmetsp:Transcript_23992/g.40241  ORF Transcript_23992/g.40241 Transcript_23992/m.40241 type:complete len:143 (-) Transcript_23992:506-934(-)|eukprot:CAMPEP_0198197320 /NCGR_PEP_ID=MMETSP1445-20131203/925_1 /TAXON_ID=36898 /ORGANISM="Pyramimonas sp., Strain CCMP2087" /LENGTH=142 /DNA_ID=CAMNT_0043866579 /DNA_START=165 /DNA_END=593 /DNA_ORIENTATION=+
MAKDAQGVPLYGGISLRNWGIIVGGLLFLYLCLGLFYASLLTIAVECRGEEYIKMPKEFFGDFSREEYYMGYGSPIEGNQEVYPWLLENTPDCLLNMKAILAADPTEEDIYLSCDPTCTNKIYKPECDTDTCKISTKECLNP